MTHVRYEIAELKVMFFEIFCLSDRTENVIFTG